VHFGREDPNGLNWFSDFDKFDADSYYKVCDIYIYTYVYVIFGSAFTLEYLSTIGEHSILRVKCGKRDGYLGISLDHV